MAGRTRGHGAVLPTRQCVSLLSLLVLAAWLRASFETLACFASPCARAFPHGGRAAAPSLAAARFRGLLAVAARGGDTDADEGATEDDDYDFAPAQVIGGLKVGQKFEGVVTNVMTFGAFVDIGGDRDGLVPRSKLQDAFTENTADVVKVGQGVTVWVVSTENDKLTLSMTPNKIFDARTQGASLELFQALDESEFIDGTVVRIAPFGAFVSVKPPGEEVLSAQGLLHLSQIQEEYLDNVEDVLEVGQAVKVRVLNVDVDAGRMGLSMKSPLGSTAAFAGIDPMEWITGKVVSMESYGAFVSVEPPGGGAAVDGLVHITQIKEGFVEDPQEELELGQEVKVRVTEVKKDGRLSLSMVEPKSSDAE